jgi:hypothetical protein
VEGPRLVSRAEFMAEQPVAETAVPRTLTSRLLRYLLPGVSDNGGN